MEEWKDVKEFEGLYQVSNKGRVRSLDRVINGKRYTGKILSSKVNAGYPIVRLCDGSRKLSVRVHRIVAETFLDNPKGLPEVNHKDGNKRNNKVGNLEWCTSRENKIHAWMTGLTKSPPAEKPKSVEQYDKETLIAIYKSIEIASILLGIDDGSICKCCMGKRITAGGYIWKYAKEGRNL